jgi:hypothetical protein
VVIIIVGAIIIAGIVGVTIYEMDKADKAHEIKKIEMLKTVPTK